MPTTTVSARFRPVRFGFLVESGSVDQLSSAASIACLLWGGMRSPIIPVSSSEDQLADQLIDLFNVDILLPVAVTESVREFLSRHSYLRAPSLYGHQFLIEDWRTKKKDVAFLDALLIMERYWRREFRNLPADSKSNCVFPTWEKEDPLHYMFATLFGYYSSEHNLRYDFATAFRKRLRSVDYEIKTNDNLSDLSATQITPIFLTGLDLKQSGGSFRSANGVYIGDATQFADLVTFWNLRAAGSATVFLPFDGLERVEPYAQAHVEYLDSLPDSHPNIEDWITFAFREDKVRVSELISRFPTRKRKSLAQYNSLARNGLSIQPSSCFFNWETSLAQVDFQSGQYEVTIALPEKGFLGESDRHTGGQYLAVSLSPYGEFSYPGHTLQPPYRRDLNEFYGREMSSRTRQTRSEPEGIGVLVAVRDKAVSLRPIRKKLVVTSILELAGATVKASQPGLLADRLLEKLDGVDGARVFKIRGVRKLVDKLAPDRSVTRGDATRTIWNDGQFSQHMSLYIEQRQDLNLDTGDVFDFLLRRGFFRAGLELQCDQCRLTGWHSLRAIDDTFVCEFCGWRNLTSLHIRDRGDWRFRKSGLLSKDNNQEGAIPVILSILVFHRIFDFGGFMYSTSLDINLDNLVCELDYVIVSSGRNGRQQVALGEAKGDGGQIDEKSFSNCRKIIERLQQIGVDGYACYSKTSDCFRDSELELVKRLRDDGVPVILLTNQEIEPYYPYEIESREGQLIHQHPMNFQEMSENSEFLYLR